MRNILGWFLVSIISIVLISICYLGVVAYIHVSETAEKTETGTMIYLEDIKNSGPMYQASAAPSVKNYMKEELPDPDIHEGRWVWAQVTAYCPCDICCGKTPNDPAYGITSTGVNVLSGNPNHAYGIAADPRAIPYGTRIYVPNYWESLKNNQNFIPTELTTVDDTGGAMRQSWERRGIIHLDVRYRTHRAALSWGVRMMQVFVYD